MVNESKHSLQQMVRTYLRAEFLAKKSKNHRYSIRSYAKFLNLDSTQLSKFLSGKKPLGKQGLFKIEKKINPNHPLKEALLKHFYAKGTDSRLVIAQDSPFEHWYELALWETIKILPEKSELLKVALQLGCTEKELDAFLNKMVSYALLGTKDHARYEIRHADISIINSKTNKGLSDIHKKMSALSLLAIDKYDSSVRATGGMTFHIHTDDMPAFKNEIIKFRQKIRKMSEKRKKRNGLYQLTISLFPLATW